MQSKCTVRDDHVLSDLGYRMRRDRFVAGPSNSVTRKELGALFDVIGTPSWADVDRVQSASWRNYLQKLPGRAPTLFRRLGFAGVHSTYPS